MADLHCQSVITPFYVTDKAICFPSAPPYRVNSVGLFVLAKQTTWQMKGENMMWFPRFQKICHDKVKFLFHLAKNLGHLSNKYIKESKKNNNTNRKTVLTLEVPVNKAEKYKLDKNRISKFWIKKMGWISIPHLFLILLFRRKDNYTKSKKEAAKCFLLFNKLHKVYTLCSSVSLKKLLRLIFTNRKWKAVK